MTQSNRALVRKAKTTQHYTYHSIKLYPITLNGIIKNAVRKSMMLRFKMNMLKLFLRSRRFFNTATMVIKLPAVPAKMSIKPMTMPKYLQI